MSRSLNALARDLQRWGDRLDMPPRTAEVMEFRAARAAALSMKIDMKRLAAAAATSIPRAGAYTAPNTGRRAVQSSRRTAWMLKASGPVHWAEWGIGGHWIAASGQDTSRRAKRRRTRAARTGRRGRLRDSPVLSDGSRTYGMYAWHRGVRARPFWFAGLDRYWPDALERAAGELFDALDGEVMP